MGRDAIIIKISPHKIKKKLEDVKTCTQWSSVFSDYKEQIDQTPVVCVMCDSEKKSEITLSLLSKISDFYMYCNNNQTTW